MEIHRRIPVLVAAALLAGLAGCNTGEFEDLPSQVAGTTVNASFTPDASPTCPRTDLVSMQAANIQGSALNIDIVVTDCDGSMNLSGLAFEVDFDSTAVKFVGCSARDLFPASQVLAGTPVCTISRGHVLGTISMTPPQFVNVGGSGTATAVRLTFNIIHKGVSSPLTFVGTDSASGTALFFLDPSTQATTIQVLGASGYAGGTLIGN